MNIHDLLPLCQTELDGKIQKDMILHPEEIPEGSKGKSFDWLTMSFASKDNFDIEMVDKKSFFDDKQHGWLWYKNLNIPTLKFKHTSLLRSSRELNVQLFAIRKSERSWTEVPLKGTMNQPFSSSSNISQLNSLRFSDTSYNYKGQKFVLIIAFYETVTNKTNHSDETQEEIEDENVKKLMQLHNQRLLSIKISPPIYVESRKKSYQERQNKIKFYEPFQPEMITKHYSKGKGQAVIQNTIDDLHTYFTTATIRHKIYHPFFMLLKFNKAIKLYYNTRIIKIDPSDDKFFYETQKEIFSNLFGTSNDTSDEPLLLMCLKKPKKQDWPKDIQKIDKFLSNIESTALSYLESSEFPFQIPEEYAEIIYSEQLKSVYTRSYNQISNLQFQMQAQRASNQSANLLYQQQFQELLSQPQGENNNMNIGSSMNGNKLSPTLHKMDMGQTSSVMNGNHPQISNQLYQLNPQLAMMGKVEDQFDSNTYPPVISLNHKRSLQEVYSLKSNNNPINNSGGNPLNKMTPYSSNQQHNGLLDHPQHPNMLKCEEWANNYINAVPHVSQFPTTTLNGFNQISPLKTHEDIIASIAQAQLQNEPGIQKKRESNCTQSDISSQNQYSSLETTKQLQSPNPLSQFSIPSINLIQENCLSPQTQARSSLMGQITQQLAAQHQQQQQQQQNNYQNQSSSTSIPSFNHIGSQPSMSNLQLSNEIPHQQLQFNQYNQMLNQQMQQNQQQQAFPNMLQQTVLQNAQNMPLSMARQNTQPVDQLQFMQQQLNLQKMQQQLNIDYIKNLQQVTQHNIGMSNLDQIMQKNNQLLSNQMTDQMIHQLYNKTPSFQQQQQLQRNHSVQQQHQTQNMNIQNFMLNRNQSTPEIGQQNYILDQGQKKSYSNLFNIELAGLQQLGSNQFNQISTTSGNDQSSNASSTTSKNVGNFYLQNQFNLMNINQIQQQSTPQFQSVKQEQQTDLSNNSQTDPSHNFSSQKYQIDLKLQNNNISNKINQNSYFQSKIEEFDYSPLGNNFQSQMMGTYPLTQSIQQQQMQHAMHKFQKKEES